MFGIVILFVMLAVATLLSLGIAFIFSVMAPDLTTGVRALWSALIAAILPISLPIVTILNGTGFVSEAIVPVAALLVGALIIAAVVCFPVAYFFSKKRDANRPAPGAEKVFD